MPIFEYRCQACEEKFSLLILKTKDAAAVKCPFCRAERILKLPSAFSVQQSEASRLKNLDLSRPRDSEFYKNSCHIGLWAKKRMEQLGVKPSSQMEEIIEKARCGKILEE